MPRLRLLLESVLATVLLGSAIGCRSNSVTFRLIVPSDWNIAQLRPDSLSVFILSRRPFFDSLAPLCAVYRDSAKTPGQAALYEAYVLDTLVRGLAAKLAADSFHLSPAGFSNRISLTSNDLIVLGNASTFLGLVPLSRKSRGEQVIRADLLQVQVCDSLAVEYRSRY